MKWFRENRFLGAILIASSICLMGAAWFLFRAKCDWNEAAVGFHGIMEELSRLEKLAPYPSGENLREMKGHADGYARAVATLKEELQTQVIPLQSLAPNEFQSRLRLTMNAVTEKAHASKVRLPDKFYLGFDEFASALPNVVAAPLLGQELRQIEYLLDALFEARIDALTSFRRVRLREEQGMVSPSPMPNRKPGAMPASGPKGVERNVVEFTFRSTPDSARRFLNQVAGTTEQFFIVRLLHVRNEKDKGPLREITVEQTNAVPVSSSSAQISAAEVKPSIGAALNFIVGNEHLEVSTKIEMVRFTF